MLQDCCQSGIAKCGVVDRIEPPKIGSEGIESRHPFKYVIQLDDAGGRVRIWPAGSGCEEAGG